jgi:hypothetical protein
MKEQRRPEKRAPRVSLEPQHTPQAGEILYYALLLFLLAVPSGVNLFWGPECGVWVGLGAAVVWFFVGRQTGLGESGCLVHLWGFVGTLLHLLYMLFLWKQLLLQQMRLK